MIKSIKSTWYEKIGGERTISEVVDRFLTRLSEDSRVNHHLIGVQMDQLRLQLTTYFMCFTLEGFCHFDAQKLRENHDDLKITSEEYEIAIKHMNASLREMNISLESIAKIEAFMRSIKPHIIHE